MKDQLIELRRNIHQNPELSGLEYDTADMLASKLRMLKPDALITGNWRVRGGGKV
jgi:metal-dependent amidase/aminoacylase/carboxypeptidase family protein